MAHEPILVVDDNEQNLKLARLILMSEGYEVSTAVNAEDVLLLLRQSRPRLILLDIQLPGMDGLELTRRLKSDPSYRDILIVALTASAMKGDEQRALDAGCDAYLAKPVDTEVLPRVLAGLIARQQESDASR